MSGGRSARALEVSCGSEPGVASFTRGAGNDGSDAESLCGAVFSLLVVAEDCDRIEAFSKVSEKAGGCADETLGGGDAAMTSGSINAGAGAGVDGISGKGKSLWTI